MPKHERLNRTDPRIPTQLPETLQLPETWAVDVVRQMNRDIGSHLIDLCDRYAAVRTPDNKLLEGVVEPYRNIARIEDDQWWRVIIRRQVLAASGGLVSDHLYNTASGEHFSQDGRLPQINLLDDRVIVDVAQADELDMARRILESDPTQPTHRFDHVLAAKDLNQVLDQLSHGELIGDVSFRQVA